MNNLSEGCEVVDNPGVAPFLSTALCIDLFLDHPLDDDLGYETDHAERQT